MVKIQIVRIRNKDKKMDITLSIPDDRFTKLKEVANNLHVTMEDLVCISIDELISRPDEDFQKAADYILKKNAELYRKLA